MKCVIFALVFLVAFSAAQRTEQETRSMFVQWAQQNNKHYESVHHMEQRLAVWRTNLEFVEAHNLMASQSKVSFTLGMNHFADLTNDEYRYMLRARVSGKPAPSTFVAQPNVTLPSSVDWRDKGVVTPVKNQGQCGSCWSFSATGSMEGAHALSTGNLVSFSEQELVDCVNGGADTCNTGGEMDQGFQYAIQNGMETEDSYPYCACSGNQCAYDSSKVVAHFSSYQDVTSGDENALQQAVANQPTVSVAIDASSMYFQLYSGGVYDDPTCKNGPDDLDHGVLTVGYGSQDGKDYWLVKNSWGASWGMSGYIMMSRNKNNQCGIATDASYVIV